MRVVQLLPELNEGGVERGVVELSRELVKRGVESIVVSAGGKLVDQIVQDGGRHVLFDVASKNLITAPLRVRKLRGMLAELGPDIIHARSRVPAWLAYLANKELHVPFVTTVHGFNSVNAYSRVMTFGDRVICVSGAIKDYVVQHYTVPQEKLVIIPRGVDLEVFNPEKLDRSFMSEFSKCYKLEGKFIVTSVGRITQLKDYETFIVAIQKLKHQIPNLVGLVVGGVREDKQAYFARLEKLITGLNLGCYVHFVGSQQRVAEIYAMSDVVVSSSKQPESFGRTAAEALAMNVPVAGSAHGGILDIVLPGKTGCIFNPEDVNGLCDAIIGCQSVERSSLRSFVCDNFTLDNMVERTVSVYLSLS